MEKKIFKTDRKFKTKVKFAEIVGDVIVPDVKPDIVNVIGLSCDCFVQKEEKSNGRLRLDGIIACFISYISENAETRSIETSFSMVEQIECENITDNSKVDYRVVVESDDIRMLNERKVQVRIMLKIEYDVYEEYELEIPDFNDFDVLGCKCLEKLESKIELKNKIGCGENKTSLKEKMNLGDGLEVAEIIKVTKQIVGIENKVSINKVLSKADFKLSVMFINEDGSIKTKEEIFSLMSFIDIQGVKEENQIDVNYKVKSLNLKLDQEKRNMLEVEGEFLVSAECYQKEMISVIEDMYSIDNKEVSFLKKDVNVLECVSQSIDMVNCYKRINIEDIENVLDMEVKVKSISNDGEGLLEAKLIYETNNKNIINIRKEEISFKVNLKENAYEELNDLRFYVINKNCTINGEYVDCDINLEVKYPKFKEKVVNLLDQIEIKERQINDSVMCMYFIKKGDTLWNIAKRFGVKMESLLKINELENENNLIVGEKLFIVR